MKKTRIFVLLLGGLAACATTDNADTRSDKDGGGDGTKTISVDFMDKKVQPQDDFFQFANGTWVKDNPVPPSESRWGSFNELQQDNMKKLTAILENAKKNGTASDGSKLIGDYYASFINMDRRNELGIAPIQTFLEKIKGISSEVEINATLSKLHRYGIRSAFTFGVSQDMKDVENHIVYLGQGGLTLPNRDYYLESEYEDIRVAYKQHLLKLAKKSGFDEKEAKQLTIDVILLETEMAKNMLRPAEMRIPENRYHKMSYGEASEIMSGFDLDTYVKSTGIAEFDSLNVGQPEYIAFIGEQLTGENVVKIRNYLYWKVLNHYAGSLSDEFVNLDFDFYGKVLSGKSEMKPINERAIEEITRQDFGEMLGRAFVEKHYSIDAQESINQLVDNLLIVFKERIQNLDWMSAETKAQATKKLVSIGRKLGFPEKWTDYSKLDFDPNEYIANIDQAAKFSHQKNLSKLNEPVDTKEWGMPAHMVNAYYHPLLNEIAFPAGIMQPPFFSAEYEDAVNYGRIGMVIGHEFTHGFDDNGSRFDAEGNFKNWWTEEDRALFDERTATLGNTFEQFCPIDGHCVNSQLTMGENIADLGGLTLAFHAYKMTDEYKSGQSRYGYTPAQRFFIAYAQLWKINYTDAELKKRIATDSHSPGMYRVNGPLKNCPEFHEAFNVQESDPMRNESSKVAKIW
ncbi:MAG: M13 family metallopeptidase [Crocinitomicaceae bacterium]